MLKEILKNYMENVAPRVDMKEEREIAERYLNEIAESEIEVEIVKAN
jgi:hypothetical protein